jgi:hypothetical protein
MAGCLNLIHAGGLSERSVMLLYLPGGFCLDLAQLRYQPVIAGSVHEGRLVDGAAARIFAQEAP